MKSVAIEIANNFTKSQGGANICRKKDRVKIKMTPLPVRILRIFSNFFNRFRQSIWQPLITDLIQFLQLPTFRE